MFTTYVLQSEKDLSYYIGYTSDLKRRLFFHNSGASFYTKRKLPWDIVFTKEFLAKGDAIRYERYLKSLKGGLKFYSETGLQRGSRSAG